MRPSAGGPLHLRSPGSTGSTGGLELVGTLDGAEHLVHCHPRQITPRPDETALYSLINETTISNIMIQIPLHNGRCYVRNVNRQRRLINWQNDARRIVRVELVRRGLTYQQLAERLEALGVEETERSIANKMSRGTFSFVFVLQCMKAIGADSITVALDVEAPAASSRGR
jgi:hypothetical protein